MYPNDPELIRAADFNTSTKVEFGDGTLFIADSAALELMQHYERAIACMDELLDEARQNSGTEMKGMDALGKAQIIERQVTLQRTLFEFKMGHAWAIIERSQKRQLTAAPSSD